MLRVVIAEDEELIREGLKRELPWSSMGMEVVATAANGLEAAALCREHRAELLLTDIRMPLLDGLELIQQVRESSPETVCLIISGYDDFHYAQKAISLGVRHYFLKPLELDQIEAKLREVGAGILRERSRQHEQELMGRFVGSVLPFVRRQYLLELIYGPDGDREVARQLAEVGALRESACCAAALLQVELEAGQGRSGAAERRLARMLRNRHYQGGDVYLLRREDREAVLLVVFLGDEPGALREQLGRYLREVRRLPRVRAAAAGGARAGLRRLHESFGEARKELLLQNLLRGGGLPAARDGREAAEAEGSTGAFDLAGVEQALTAGDLRRLEELLEGLESSLAERPATAGERSALLTGLYHLLSRQVEASHLDLETTLRRSGAGPGFDRGAGGFGAVLAALRRIAREAAAGPATRRELPAHSLVDTARSYIESRYCAWDLSLEDVAEHVELNPSYLSTLFKSVLGVNYIDYLTGLRMDKARQLLEGTELKVGAVARLVGFQTPGYFGYLFKKHFGLTPTEYRARPGGGEGPQKTR
ncbi:MAG: response regulator [Spirochaetales bacterium]|nr:response regulator [Spirochaetales bacterium]